MSSARLRTLQPALLTRMSILPYAASAAAAAARMLASLRTSQLDRHRAAPKRLDLGLERRQRIPYAGW